jgi:hypothetical protein
MAGLSIFKRNSRRILIYTGEVSNLATELHDRAMEDPQLEKAIMTAATAISFTNKSKQIGEHLIEMVLYP